LKQQESKRVSPKVQIQQWEKEMNESGKISDEAQLIEAIRHESDSVTLSTLLTIGAISRLERNKEDSLAAVWLE
jgi:hypothetical protein